MSHFSMLRTTLVEKEFLLRALEDLGFRPEVGTVQVRGFGGNRTLAEIRVPTKNPGYDIGFRKAGEAYEMVADWWGIRDLSPQELLERLAQRYAYHATRAKLEEQGFTLVSEETNKDGQIHLVLRRLA
ncbi:MAG TPA: DUF1257 domain-containing protein [Gemmataceae bacterium]|nr:DUF1257 domain-containing protein [Gemmataceae bacterium]